MNSLLFSSITASTRCWALFVALIFGLLAAERVIFTRATPNDDATPLKATLLVTLLCGLAAALFAGGLAVLGGPDGAAQAALFGTVYVVEFALSIDNLFVFLLIFKSFNVGPQEARRVLTWGIVGAVVLRGLFIAAGSSLFSRFDGLFYGVGAFLVFSGGRLLWTHDAPPKDVTHHWAMRAGARILPMASPEAIAAAPKNVFMVTENGKVRFTQLLLVLLAIEASDVVFALDSVPASFAITTQTRLIFFANMFAVMGLRCLYALLAQAAGALRFLHVALAMILMLIGAKMLTRHYVDVPDALFLALIVAVLALSTVASLVAGPEEGKSTV